MFDHTWTKISKTRTPPCPGDLCWMHIGEGDYMSFSGKHYHTMVEQHPNATHWRTQYVCPDGNYKKNLDAATKRQQANGQRGEAS